MNEKHMQRFKKEDVQEVNGLSLVTDERVPYITYKESRYVYIDNAGEYFVSKDDITYPQLATFLSEEALDGTAGELFTMKNSEAIRSLFAKEQESNQSNTSEISTTIDINSEPLTSGVLNIDGLNIDGSKFHIEEIKSLDERVDVSSEEKNFTKKQKRKKKNQA